MREATQNIALSRELKAFCDRIGVEFSNPGLLVRALTHGSISSATRPDNQRLEFLGDRMLGLVMAEALLSRDLTAAEGVLAPRFNALVRREACASVARDIGLGDVLKLGKSEMLSGGRRKEALLADAMEAVIAAVYIDGGFEVAREMILRLWGARINDVKADARDPKTSLQEFVQARGEQPPSYEIVGRSGPDHQPQFTVAVTLADGRSCEATAGSKRQAEQAAAEKLLKELSNG